MLIISYWDFRCCHYRKCFVTDSYIVILVIHIAKLNPVPLLILLQWLSYEIRLKNIKSYINTCIIHNKFTQNILPWGLNRSYLSGKADLLWGKTKLENCRLFSHTSNISHSHTWRYAFHFSNCITLMKLYSSVFTLIIIFKNRRIPTLCDYYLWRMISYRNLINLNRVLMKYLKILKYFYFIYKYPQVFLWLEYNY